MNCLVFLLTCQALLHSGSTCTSLRPLGKLRPDFSCCRFQVIIKFKKPFGLALGMFTKIGKRRERKNCKSCNKF